MELFMIFIAAMLVNNFVLSKFLGICSFLGVSKKKDAAIGMGLAVTFVMTLASIMSWLVYTQILVRFELELAIKKLSPALHKALGIYLPLITTNCAVLGMATLNIQESYNFIESVVNGLGAASGYMLSIVLLSFIRERIDNNENIPVVLRGLPITLFTAALMSIAFLGFQGLIH